MYCRLSVDDVRLGESISIESQNILLVRYCKDHAIKNYEIYDDDGYSATNFDRPKFSRMYDDIKRGLNDRIVVHDKEIGFDGKEYQQIEIYYQFIGRLDATKKAKRMSICQ